MIAFQSTNLFILAALLLLLSTMTDAFAPKPTTNSALAQRSISHPSSSSIFFFGGNNDKDDTSNQAEEQPTEQKGGFFQDLKGMMDNFDDVVDDFVYKRMGAGEQWYGKRKYNPSGRVDGKYNGMGQSDQFRIEIARVQREEMEKKRQRRLEEEEARRNNQMS